MAAERGPGLLARQRGKLRQALHDEIEGEGGVGTALDEEKRLNAALTSLPSTGLFETTVDGVSPNKENAISTPTPKATGLTEPILQCRIAK